KRLKFSGKILHQSQWIIAGHNSAGNDQRAVESLAKVLSDQIVIHFRWLFNGEGTSIRERKPKLESRHGHNPEANNNRKDSDYRFTGDKANPGTKKARLLRCAVFC